MDIPPDIVEPLSPQPSPARAQGRPADRLAVVIAGLAALLPLAAVIWFIWGFVAEDGLSHTTFSATILAFGVASLAVLPAMIIAWLAWKSWRRGIGAWAYVGVVFLALPWVIVSGLSLLNSPLPLWTGITLLALHSLLCLWALISLILIVRNAKPASPVDTLQRDVTPSSH